MKIDAAVTDIAAILSKGDSENGIPLPLRDQLGREAHRSYLASFPASNREVPVRGSFRSKSGWELEVHGRIDGIRESRGKKEIVEFKTVALATDDFAREEYQPQARFVIQTRIYAYLYAHGIGNGASVASKLVLQNLADGKRREFRLKWDESEVTALLERYIEECRKIEAERVAESARRKVLAQALVWPLDDYRPGQEEIAKAVAEAISDGSDLLLNAPTGLGKTMAVLYGALRETFKSGRRVFYATAKGEGRVPVRRELERLHASAGIRTLLFAPREILCLLKNEGSGIPNCSDCPWNQLRHVLSPDKIWKSGIIGADELRAMGKELDYCPAALARAPMGSADIVVGDYNYVFSPEARLPDFQEPRADGWVLLLDEAHNLFDRIRDVFSIKMVLGKSLALAEELEASLWRFSDIKATARFRRELKRVSAELQGLQDTALPASGMIETTVDGESWGMMTNEFGIAAAGFLAASGQQIRDDESGAVWSIFRMLERMNMLLSLDRASHPVYADREGDSIGVVCLDPTDAASGALARFDAVVAFSGTLVPMDFYRDFLGGSGRPTVVLEAASPFDQKQRLIALARGVDTRYGRRRGAARRIADAIIRLARLKKGGYLAVFPSLEFASLVAPLLESPEVEIIVQKAGMDIAERTAFRRLLKRRGRTTIAVVVAGGQFTEAADYPGDDCVGVVIVGPCLPPPDPLREALREYWDRRSQNGWAIAYLHPAVRRVIQAGGRLLRGDKDRGVILLLDDRFLGEPYFDLLPSDWQVSINRVGEDWEGAVIDFWECETPVAEKQER